MARVLYMVNDLDTGGAQTLIEALIACRADRSYVVVLLGPGSLSRRLESVADGVYYLDLNPRFPNLFGAARRVRRLTKILQIDVVHSHLLQSDMLALLSRRTPVVTTIHTSGGHESSLLSRVVGALVAILSRRFSAVIACSESAKGYARRKRYGNVENIRVIRNGVVLPEDVAPNERAQTLLCLSRWHPMKDHETLLAAFSIVRQSFPNACLLLAGSGIAVDNTELLNLVAKYRLEAATRILGPVDDLTQLFSAANALVISSSHGEALPMAGLEALASSVPVVTTNVGDCQELAIDPRLVVPPSSVLALATALGLVLGADAAESRQFRLSARERAETRFDITKTVDEYELIYLAATGGSDVG